ncbi:hypothetical protein [Streptomyces sp. NPDC053048]|uniref:hypothetical protein n=1 Tax=Streptomyces sp. NPDC053048 TaxID=3365694 RepID=UPI0037CDF6A3
MPEGEHRGRREHRQRREEQAGTVSQENAPSSGRAAWTAPENAVGRKAIPHRPTPSAIDRPLPIRAGTRVVGGTLPTIPITAMTTKIRLTEPAWPVTRVIPIGSSRYSWL